MVLATTAVETLGLAFGAGAVAIVLLLLGLLGMLGTEDRGKLLGIMRHPLRTVFAEPDQPDEDD